MLVHGYQQVRRLAGLPKRSSLHRIVQATREKSPDYLDAVTVGIQKGIAVTETVVGRAAGAAPRPNRQSMEGFVERAVRWVPHLTGRPVEVALMAATLFASVVLAVVLINGIRSASADLIDVVDDAVGAALIELELSQP